MEQATRVLVIDDNADVAESLALGLKRYGWNVRTAPDGLTGLEVAIEFRPRIVMIDIALPIIDGWELAERFRMQPLFKHPRLIALTALDRSEHRARSLSAGFEQHIVKPVKLAALHQVLSTPPRSAAVEQRELPGQDITV